MKKTYTFEIIWTDGYSRKTIKTFSGCKTKVKAENWMFAYIRNNGYFASEFILKKTVEA